MKTFVYLLAGFGALAAACGSSQETPAGAAGSSATGSGGGGAPAAAGGTSNSGAPSTAGSQQTSGAGGVVPGAGSGGMNGGSSAGSTPVPPGIYAPGSCSEATLRTAPPVEKAAFKAAPIDTKFPFSEHWVGEWIADTDPVRIGMQTLADLDDDGDLDFAAGQRHTADGGMVWWEHCSADHWVAHKVGTGHKSQSSGDALDVDGDGLNNLLAGDSWYKNPGKSREMAWTRFGVGTPIGEELTVGDVTGDGKAEIIYVDLPFLPQWWSPGPNPEKNFVKGGELGHAIQQGTAWGDLNGDKANDYLVSKDYWYENNGTGTAFTEHAITATAGFDPQPLTYIGDLDSDGDNDFAMTTHWLGAGSMSRLAWVENVDGQGLTWKLRQFPEQHKFTHGVILADFDNDKDLDILWAQNVGPSFIFDNTDGKGTFVEHQIVEDFRGHTPRAGDVDCDGDLNLVGSPWGDRNQASSGESVGEPARDALYLQNMTVENGGPAIFDDARKPFELGWRERPHCRF